MSEPLTPHAIGPVKASRMFTAIIEAVIDIIDAQGLKAGNRLPNEGQLTQMLSVSRPTLRQALRVLESAQIISVRKGQHGGIFVETDMIPIGPLAEHMAHEFDSIESLLLTRRLLEPIVVHLAAEFATPAELDRIQYTIDRMDHYRNSAEMVTRADYMYHRRVAMASHNETLRRTMNRLHQSLLPLFHALGVRIDDVDRVISVHSSQLTAMRAKDHTLLDILLRETLADLERDAGLDFPYGVRWHRLDEERTITVSPFLTGEGLEAH